MHTLIKISHLTVFNIYVVCGFLGSIVLILLKPMIQNRSILLFLSLIFCSYICFDILNKYGLESLMLFILISGIITIFLSIINHLRISKQNKKR